MEEKTPRPENTAPEVLGKQPDLALENFKAKGGQKASRIEIPEFTAEDYLNTTAPFEWLYQYHDNPFQMKQLCNRMSSEALAKAKVRNFVALFGEYCKMLNGTQSDFRQGQNQTDFSGQELALWCGSWDASDSGIFCINRFGERIEACSHPIYPLRLMRNIDSGLEKLEIHWRRGNEVEQKRIFSRSVIASANSIVHLADYGVAVNSENAKYLVKFLHDVESLNYDRLDRISSVGRLGWIDGYGFSPYIENLIFDGEDTYADRFAAVQGRGSYKKWMEAMKSFRATENPIIRIIFAASLASVLVKHAGIMPFVVHLWGRGGSGKTVVMMVAASIWGNPEIGKYIKSFNGTAVSKELGAVFLNSLPLMLDELQIANHDRNKLRQMIYELTEGVGRERGRKDGGLQKSGTWRNVTITTGEQPIVESFWTEGAKYRTIEIGCSGTRFFESGNIIGRNAKEIVNFITKHYGHFGREFISCLEQEDASVITALHDKFAEEIKVVGDIDSKQALSAALILTADTLAEKWIFHDGIRLGVNDILPHLITRSDADQDRKAFEYLQECVSIYRIHFDPETATTRNTEVWGEFKTTRDGREYIAIYPSRFIALLENGGYNPAKFIEWARDNGFLRVGRDGKSSVSTKIAGAKKAQRCYWLLLSNELPEEDDGDFEELDVL